MSSAEEGEDDDAELERILLFWGDEDAFGGTAEADAVAVAIRAAAVWDLVLAALAFGPLPLERSWLPDRFMVAERELSLLPSPCVTVRVDTWSRDHSENGESGRLWTPSWSTSRREANAGGANASAAGQDATALPMAETVATATARELAAAHRRRRRDLVRRPAKDNDSRAGEGGLRDVLVNVDSSSVL
mmetsp:Transcript_29575/g.62163  ORF Transcript_29575/g.62163 Transcript_29575/m.62163 type:complete len:189 (+) Transcript_29575:1910-2476(+)